VRGGRSLNELNRVASQHHQTRARRESSACAGERQLVFLAVCVDPSPHTARASSPAKWPHLRHYWIDAASIGELNIGFVPNRVVCDGRATQKGGRGGAVGKVLRWWDGTAGNVLKGPHGKSRGNGSHSLDELREVLLAPPT